MKPTHNFTLVNADTDSISFCKQDESPFSIDEQRSLLDEINSLLPERIKFESDGYFPVVLCLKAKNYILYDGKTIKKKGSSLKSSTLEYALKEFLDKIIHSLIFEKNDLLDIYHEYVREINNVKDIKRWASKKTITEKTLNSERANETKIKDAIEDSDYTEGDKVYIFFKSNNELELVENFKGDYNKDKLYEKLYKTMERFETIINIDSFLNFKLKRNKGKLEEVLNVSKH